MIRMRWRPGVQHHPDGERFRAVVVCDFYPHAASDENLGEPDMSQRKLYEGEWTTRESDAREQALNISTELRALAGARSTPPGTP